MAVFRFQGCVLAPSLFNNCTDWVLGKVTDQSRCGASVGNIKVTDLVSADDVVLLAASLHEEAMSSALVSWVKTKVPLLGGSLNDTIQSVHAFCENEEVTKTFTYLDSVVHNSSGSHQEITTARVSQQCYGFA